MSEINYRTDVPKHYIRRECWLPACKKRKAAIKRHWEKTPLRYFTFCAADAIDVFMLAREGLLKRSATNGRLESVYFCEKDPQAFGAIASLIGSPDQGFLGTFDKIVLFEDTPETQDKNLYDDNDIEYPEQVRKQLKLKDAHQRLRKSFPFDIINLDVYGAMFPVKETVITPLLKSILKILEWQFAATFTDRKPCNEFTLLLTSHVSPRKMNQQAKDQLIDLLDANITSYPNFKEAFEQQFKHCDAKKLADEKFEEFFCFSLPKFIIKHSILDIGWDVEYGPIYLYDRKDTEQDDAVYHMMHSVATFKRLPDTTNQLNDKRPMHYTQSVISLMNQSVQHLSSPLGEALEEQINEDINKIISYRDIKE